MEQTRIDIHTVHPGRLYPLALETINLYRKFMQRPDAQDLLEQKKVELRARGVS